MTDETTLREELLLQLERGQKFLQESPIKVGKARMFTGVTWNKLTKLFHSSVIGNSY